MIEKLQLRDIEVLRTIGRLRYITTKEIHGAFFTEDAVARKRLRHLVDLDLIARHEKGLPDQVFYRTWRLTPPGVGLYSEIFPEDRAPDGLADRLIEASLSNYPHRQALNRLYLNLVALGVSETRSPVDDMMLKLIGSDVTPLVSQPGSQAKKMPGMAEKEELQRRMLAIRQRASRVNWQPDGDVVLRFKILGQEQQIVPDATVTSRLRPTLVYVELDRATRNLKRIAENLRRYQFFFRNECAALNPGLDVLLLYVVGSEMRKKGISGVAQKLLSGLAGWEVLLERDAVRWLDSFLIHEEGRRPTPDPGGSRPARQPSPGSARPQQGSASGPEHQVTSDRSRDPELAAGMHQLFELARELYRTYRGFLERSPAEKSKDAIRRLHEIHGELSRFAERVA